jgi:hypothetical protein
MDKFKRNDKVRLDSFSNFVASSRNPKMGTIYECSGKVINIIGTPYKKIIAVEWKNGAINNYMSNHLIKDDESEPNINSVW